MAITKRTRITASSRMPRRSASASKFVRSASVARPVTASRTLNRPVARPRSINAGTSITASARRRATNTPVMGASKVKLNAKQQIFCNTLRANIAKSNRSVMAATNTSNIMAKPAFTELLPLFVQKLLLPEVMGTVAMTSRQQLIPYFKFLAENTKGVTAAGDILSSPFANRQGIDPNFTGRVVKNEAVNASTIAYTPILPGSVSIEDGTNKYYDDGAGNLVDAGTSATAGTINYALGTITGITGDLVASYEYDNETVGPDQNGNYGAKMGKAYFNLDEINLVATAHQLSCYWSIYSAFAASTEWGSDLETMSKEAAIGEITAEINSAGFKALTDAATYKPQFNWDASPVLGGAIDPQGYLNMFQMKLNNAASSIYQGTRTTRPNRLLVGSTVSDVLAMMPTFQPAAISDTVGPFKFGTLGNYEVYVDPNMDMNTWVMLNKSDDLRRNAALFGEYMPVVATEPIVLADNSVQQGYASMYAIEVINPDLIVSGKITGSF